MFTTPLSAALYSNRNSGLVRSATTRVIYAQHRSFTGLRWISRESTIKLCLLVLVATCYLTQVCKGEAMVSGKPVSHWVAQLEDRDKRLWFKAFDALRFCTKDDLKGARKRLREMAVGGNIFSRNAALLLFDKFHEVDPKFADAYLVTNGDETYVRGRSAIKALAASSPENRIVALDAMMRKNHKIDEKTSWRQDFFDLTHEFAAEYLGKK